MGQSIERPSNTASNAASNAVVRSALRRAVDATGVEGLEPRRLLASDPLTLSIFKSGRDAWLNIIGTPGADTIVVERTASTSYTISNGTWSLAKAGTFVGVRVLAGAGDDTFGVSGVPGFRVSVMGEAGNDSLAGGTLNDILSGGIGEDSLEGGAGNDALLGDLGHDMLIGGAGNDALTGAAGDDQLIGGDGNDALNGGDGNDSHYGEAGNDALTAGIGEDVLDGGAGLDVLNGQSGDDLLIGGAENDRLTGDQGNDTLVGEAGNDLLSGGAGDDDLDGGDDGDSLTGDTGNDVLAGGSGLDLLNGGIGTDSVDAGDGDDKVVGSAGSDTTLGGGGLDSIDFTALKLALSLSFDGVANDGALGETGNLGGDFETLTGGSGSDVITGNDVANILYGGLGHDTINGMGGDDRLYGGAGLDSINAGDGNDSVYGQGDADKLFGDAGEDLLEGGAGNDVYDAGAGRDRLIAIGGGVGDSLTGGEGLDSFWLDSDLTEKLLDVDSAETNARATHRVKAFVNYGSTVISKEVAGQKLAEPQGSGKVVNFKNNKLFADGGPTADDISQGQTGDCWYLSSLAAVADTNAEVLRQSVTDLGDGTYAVRFFHPGTGAEQYVRVDADFYTYSWSSSTLIYASTGAQGSIWAAVMEKAFTWVRGGALGKYSTISGGWMNEAYARMGLTTTATWKGALGDDGSMIEWLRTHLDGGKAVTAGFINVSGANLVGSHAYTVDRIVDNGDGTFDVVLRNPWGSDGYTCDDGANDGYVRLTSAQLFSNYTALMAA